MTKENDTALFAVSQKAVIYNPETKKFLLMKYSGEKSKYKAWSFVGGRVEEKESPLDALKREIAEEVGTIGYEIIGAVDTHSSDNTFRIGYLVFYKGGEIALSAEHEEFFWFTREEIEGEKFFHPGVKQFIDAAAKAIDSQEYLTDLKRLQADFENYKKRQVESQKELAGYLIEKLLFDLFPVLDNFRAATAHVPPGAKDSPWVTGIQYIEKQLEDALKSHGVEVIEVKEGDAFDPATQEAVSSKEQEASEEKSGKQVVEKVLQNGYKIGGRVVRAAKVSIINQ